MFSKRLPWPAPRNRLALLLQEKRARGAPILDLTESNPTRVGLDYPTREIAAALAATGAAAYEPDPRGLAEAREAVAACYRRRGLEASPDRIVLTSSTSEAYAFLFKMLGDPGEAVLAPRPSYPLFDFLAALESLRVVTYPIAIDGVPAIDLQALEREAEDAEGAALRTIIVVSPNNPTGSALRASERAGLEAIAVRRRLPIVADEVFFDYPFADPAGERPAGGPIVSMLSPLPRAAAGERALAFTLGGLSKSCGLPQIKLAWIVVSGPEREAGEAIERLELIADTYLSVGAPAQRAAPRLIEIGEGIGRSIRERVRENRRALAGLSASLPACRLLPADGGWSAVLQVPAVLPEEELVLRLLAEDDTLVHPGYFFDFPREAFLVVSLLPPADRFLEGVRRILARVAAL